MADMTAHSGYTRMTRKASDIQPTRELEPMESRTLRRFLGFVFAITIVGLWLAPGANWSPDILLMKTGISAILCFCTIVALLPRF